LLKRKSLQQEPASSPLFIISRSHSRSRQNTQKRSIALNAELKWQKTQNSAMPAALLQQKQKVSAAAPAGTKINPAQSSVKNAAPSYKTF